jgi:hypothetical protein
MTRDAFPFIKNELTQQTVALSGYVFKNLGKI